jgi:S-layer homology domain
LQESRSYAHHKRGLQAAHLCKENCEAKDYLKDFKRLRNLQRELVEHGAPIYWFDDVPTDHESFPAIQFLAATNIFPGDVGELSFRPDEPVTEEEVCMALGKIFPTEKLQDYEPNKQATRHFVQNLCKSSSHMFKDRPVDGNESITRSQLSSEIYRTLSR